MARGGQILGGPNFLGHRFLVNVPKPDANFDIRVSFSD